MDENQENKRRYDRKRIQKDSVIKETLQKLENGVFEVYQFDGPSDVWKDFVKIRECGSQERVDFVQCIGCKGLLSFKEGSGTSHLLRHKCPKVKGDESFDATKFRCLPLDKIVQTRRSIANEIVKYCTADMISCEAMCDSQNFLNFSQSLVSHGYKNGCIDLRTVFPSCNYVNRAIANIKEEKLQDICEIFRHSVKRHWCSVTIGIRNFVCKIQRIKVVVVGIQYFEKELAGMNKKFCSSFILNEDDTPEIFESKLVKHFNVIGVDKSDLQAIKIVTPNEELFSSIFSHPIIRRNCAVGAITKILNAAFKTTATTEKFDTMWNCRGIVNYIKLTEKYNIKLEEDDGSWKSKLCMVRSITENYDEILKILDDEDMDFQFNKRKADELVSFLEPFVEAIDDLTAVSNTTANKILLWHGVLSDHLENNDNSNVELSRIKNLAKGSFEAEFCPTIDNKVDCFLDPRYKHLKMLTDIARRQVVIEVRRLLDTLEVNEESLEAFPSDDVPASKKNRFSNLEAGPESKKKEKAKQTSRFAKFETNNDELGEMDEVDIYLKLPGLTTLDFSNEFGIISKFWKQQKNKLPKLFKLATTRLHVPAGCGEDGMKNCKLIQNLDPQTVSDYLFVSNNN